MKLKPRSESTIFSDLEFLCCSPGYIHAIAFFCFRDNTVGYANKMKVEDLLQQYTNERLVRSEISTLIGLACKQNLDSKLPQPEIIQEYIDRTEKLLEELHQSMMQPMIETLSTLNPSSNPFASGQALREPIFYSGEGAYNFQYRDFSFEKYKNDDAWFVKNKGYSIRQANAIISAIYRIQNNKLTSFMNELPKISPEKWTCLSVYTFTVDEIVKESKEEKTTVNSFIKSFVVPESINKKDFKSLGDFSPLNAYPIIELDENEFLLFQSYSLSEALYETPFYWLVEDTPYKDTALKNRGEFTEEFSKKRLENVFGKGHVFTNVNIYDKKTRVGEIDVLVTFANRAIVLQAKSKKLTLEARKGNDNSLKEDFKKAVQDAYNQAYLCAGFLIDNNYNLVDAHGNKMDISREYKEIYPFCVVSEHYPSLSFQARQFLKYQKTEFIMPPYVMDIFFLDVVCEMLHSPLYFLSYINRRILYGDKIFSSHELTILSQHLKHNLWIEESNTMMMLDDDIGVDLDLAMLARRDDVSGDKTPSGILTKYRNTFFGKLITQIEKIDDASCIDLGLLFLKLNGTTIEILNKNISKLIKLSKRDEKNHDLTLGIGEDSTGFTIHCNKSDRHIAETVLRDHCLRRKYIQKANSWFGICINPIKAEIRFVLNFDFEWLKSDEMDNYLSGLMIS